MSQRFEFDFDRRFRPLLRVLGISPDNSIVELTDDDQLRVAFGRIRLRTPIDNISGLEITRDYSFLKAIGPRWSLVDSGVTFGTNTRVGVCTKFHEPVPALLGYKRPHPGMTVTVADPDGLVAALRDRGVD